jgi:hypothetical protein
MTLDSVVHTITACRVCSGAELRSLLELGDQALTGVFPRSPDAPVTTGPLDMVQCSAPGGCGLVQLRHSYPPTEMYGANYGYRSSLNQTMVTHLGDKVKGLLARRPLSPGDVVLDIGSNDGTTLSFYPETATLIGMDPTIAKFAKYYRPHIQKVADFFNAPAFFKASGGKKARIVTSIAMFYDLERPIDFMRDIHAVLADDGIWHLEQSYLPSMLATHAYDAICHEHIEYYALQQIVWMADRVGFSIVDVALNDANAGSFAVSCVRSEPGAQKHAPAVLAMLENEKASRLPSLDPFLQFVKSHKTTLHTKLSDLKLAGRRVLGMGASTKGNVILQYCGIGPDLLECIAEVNEDKFGCFTPGTRIPIVSEADALAKKPDVMLILPWHFRENLMRRYSHWLDQGIGMLFPLPEIEFVSSR